MNRARSTVPPPIEGSSSLALVPAPSVGPRLVRHESIMGPGIKNAPRDPGVIARNMARVRFVRLREALGLTQLECAVLLDAGSSSVENWERGAVKLPAWALVRLEMEFELLKERTGT